MAIIKRAKNLIVNIKNEYRHFSGSYECVSDEVQIIATEGNLTLTSAKKIAVKKGSDNTTAKSVVEQNKNGVKGGNSDMFIFVILILSDLSYLITIGYIKPYKILVL